MQQNMMGQNIIITEPSKNLRALGRNALTGKWQLAIIAVIVYDLCLQIPPVVLNAIFGSKGDLYGVQSGYYDVDIYNSVYNSIPNYSFLSGIYTLLVTGAFVLGITLFFLAVFRRQQVGVSDIFLGFEHFGKALGLMLFQTLFILLWALLFIVPGIIAAIRYSQAVFILADDPTKGIRQCMNESKMMMKGNKSKYFCLSLSFIGWILLAAIPESIITSIPAVMSAPVFVQSLADVIGSLFIVPVTAYMYSTEAGFYEILAGHLIKETEPAPIPGTSFGQTSESTHENTYHADDNADAATSAPTEPVVPQTSASSSVQTTSAVPSAYEMPTSPDSSDIHENSAVEPVQEEKQATQDDDDFFYKEV